MTDLQLWLCHFVRQAYLAGPSDPWDSPEADQWCTTGIALAHICQGTALQRDYRAAFSVTS